MKIGVDDFLMKETAWPLEAYKGLKRTPLTADQFKPLHAWYQKREERQAVEGFYADPNAEQMDILDEAGLYSVSFPTYNICFSFGRCADARGGVQAELTVCIGTKEILGETDVNLKSASARRAIASSLKDNHEAFAAIPWKPLLDRACATVLKRHRCGEPIILLEPAEFSHVPFILNPFVYQGHPSLIYAPGGSFKSYLALWFALLVCHGHHTAGVAGVRSPVLYLDWELNRETTGARLRQLTLGHPELNHARPRYRQCELPLLKEVHAIATTVADAGIKFIVIDSAAMACGGDLASPDAAIGLQQAFRKLGCGSLTLAHMAKNPPDGQPTSAYGTVFFRELARNVWELTRAEESNRLILKHMKDNFSPRRDPMGFELEFVGEAVRIVGCDPETEPEFESKLPIASRIRNLLEDGAPRSSKEIADALGLKINGVKSTLSNKRYRGNKWSMIGEGRDAKWTVLNR